MRTRLVFFNLIHHNLNKEVCFPKLQQFGHSVTLFIHYSGLPSSLCIVKIYGVNIVWNKERSDLFHITYPYDLMLLFARNPIKHDVVFIHPILYTICSVWVSRYRANLVRVTTHRAISSLRLQPNSALFSG